MDRMKKMAKVLMEYWAECVMIGAFAVFVLIFFYVLYTFLQFNYSSASVFMYLGGLVSFLILAGYLIVGEVNMGRRD